MGELRDSLKQNLNHYLSISGMTQKEFAIKLGVSQAAVTNWTKGNNSPDIDVIAQICDILGITINELIKSDSVEKDTNMVDDSSDKIAFGDRLREARLQKGLTQEQLAQQIGVAKSTLTGYEKGNREPDVFKIKKILEALDVDSDYLLGIDRKKESPESAATNSEDTQYEILGQKIYETLLACGYVEEGQELTDTQIDFLDGLSAIISAYFNGSAK